MKNPDPSDDAFQNMLNQIESPEYGMKIMPPAEPFDSITQAMNDNPILSEMLYPMYPHPASLCN